MFSTPGYTAARSFLGRFRDDYDFIVVNGENAAGGFGITRKHFEGLLDAGADVAGDAHRALAVSGSAADDDGTIAATAWSVPEGTPCAFDDPAALATAVRWRSTVAASNTHYAGLLLASEESPTAVLRTVLSSASSTEPP